VLVRLVGVGFKVKLEKDCLFLKVGYSHLIQMPIPVGIEVDLSSPTKIILKGIDYPLVTQFAAKIRSKKKPEPYNGKGIFVDNETVIRKEGKKK
jgi:large subunit ribosomal protein L6